MAGLHKKRETNPQTGSLHSRPALCIRIQADLRSHHHLHRHPPIQISERRRLSEPHDSPHLRYGTLHKSGTVNSTTTILPARRDHPSNVWTDSPYSRWNIRWLRRQAAKGERHKKEKTHSLPTQPSCNSSRGRERLHTICIR